MLGKPKQSEAQRPNGSVSSFHVTGPGFEAQTRQATRGLLVTDHEIFNHGQVTWTTPELAPPSPNYPTTPTGALDGFNMHCSPTRQFFSGTGLELVTRPATIRYLYHSATAASQWPRKPSGQNHGLVAGVSRIPSLVLLKAR
ncbi:uncharacterized protein TNCV_1823201 [Trichonephila clavipes]|nr:uncharacterized protein TNCV_1823201 [Trichonephila clavipes]